MSEKLEWRILNNMLERKRDDSRNVRWVRAAFLAGMSGLLVAAVGCSGSEKTKTANEPRPTARQSGSESETLPEHRPSVPGGAQRDEEQGEGLQVKGLLGTIDEQTIAKAFGRKRYQIEQCVMKHARAMTYITGVMKLRFEVATDGEVTVKVLEDDIGNYEVENCLLEVAKSLSFGKPKGGKARVTYPLTLPSRGTPVVEWGKARVRGEIRSKRRAIMKCRQSGRPKDFTLHFYVLPGGRMMSLGAHAKGGVPDGFAACVYRTLKDVEFPDTLGKVAKVSYSF